MKKRRSFLQQLLLGLGAEIGSTSLTSFNFPKKPKTLDGPFVHIVFFWLKEPGNSDARDKFLRELKGFIDNTPIIKTQHIGTPADTSRPVIDSSYTYSLVTAFDSKKEHDEYQAHPLHKQFIENAQDLWEKVQVYDSNLLKG